MTLKFLNTDVSLISIEREPGVPAHISKQYKYYGEDLDEMLEAQEERAQLG
jgi:hypothetical protein